MLEAPEHLEVVAAVAVYGDLPLLDAEITRQVRHCGALVHVLVGKLEHARIEGRVDHAVGMSRDEVLEVALARRVVHMAVDLQDVASQDVGHGLVKAAAREKLGAHGTHYEPHEAFAPAVSRMALAAVGHEDMVVAHALEPDVGKLLKQLFKKVLRKGLCVDELVVGVVDHGAVHADAVHAHVAEAELAALRGAHGAPGGDRKFEPGIRDGTDRLENRTVYLVKEVKERPVEIACEELDHASAASSRRCASRKRLRDCSYSSRVMTSSMRRLTPATSRPVMRSSASVTATLTSSKIAGA